MSFKPFMTFHLYTRVSRLEYNYCLDLCTTLDEEKEEGTEQTLKDLSVLPTPTHEQTAGPGSSINFLETFINHLF